VATIEEHPITSISDFLALLPTLQGPETRKLWYRGSPWPSRPSLYRHPEKTTIAQFKELEAGLIARFRQLWVPFQTRTLEGEFEHLFMMQHYGVPTRLLDWTESPLVGLYFACTQAADEVQNGDGIMWVIDPVRWNSSVRPTVDRVVMPDDAVIRGYSPGNTDWEATMDMLPMAMYGTHNSTRIVAQKGVFMVFGQDVRDIQTAFCASTFDDRVLALVRIPKADIPHLRTSLYSLGITHGAVYPDLEHIALDLKREFGFGDA
jgi:hypothetical protein